MIYFFLSSWIANFGVVPLFLFLAFLTLPLLTFLFARLSSVTAVLETISGVLFNNVSRYLPPLRQTVKSIFLSLAFFIMPGVLKTQTTHNILISKGEHKEIQIMNLGKISVGNPEILSYKYDKGTQTLLIKGKKLGFTELIAWTQSKIKRRYQVYVLSKNKQLNILHLAKTLKAIGLKAKIGGPLIIASGEVFDIDDYSLLLRLEKKFRDYLHLKVKISGVLKKKITNIIKSHIIDLPLEKLTCQTNQLKVVCILEKGTGPDPAILKYLTKTFNISFIQYVRPKTKNYSLKLKIIQVERQNGETIGFNLDQSSFFLGEIFKIGLKKFLKKNDVYFTNNKILISTLAEPEIILVEDKKSTIEIGAEIPFKQLSEDKTPHTSWKFAGLRIKTLLKKIGKNFQIDYEILVSRPKNSDSISGNREKSTVILRPGQAVKLFQIGFKTEGRNKEGVPFLGHVPILSALFGTSSTQTTYKKITGIILLEEYHDRKENL